MPLKQKNNLRFAQWKNFALIQPPLEGFGLRRDFMITPSPENFCLRETVKWFLPIVDKSAHFLSDFL